MGKRVEEKKKVGGWKLVRDEEIFEKKWKLFCWERNKMRSWKERRGS